MTGFSVQEKPVSFCGLVAIKTRNVCEQQVEIGLTSKCPSFLFRKTWQTPLSLQLGFKEGYSGTSEVKDRRAFQGHGRFYTNTHKPAYTTLHFGTPPHGIMCAGKQNTESEVHTVTDLQR